MFPVCTISRTNNLTQTHALYLEWHCLQAATEAARYQSENGTRGTRPHTPAPLEADCLEMFETGHALLATLGYPLFDPVRTPATPAAPVEEFCIKSSGANARGLYTPDGFVVLAGSTARRASTPSYSALGGDTARDALIESKVLRDDGQVLVFEKDHLFKSPSGAACVVLASSVNGWDYWLDSAGRSLNLVKRQQPSGA